MSGPIQTVNFIPPTQIQALTQQVTPSGIVTQSITSTGTIFSYGDVQGANILNMQNQIRQLQTSGQSQVSTSYSYFGGNTDALMNNVPSVDQFGSKHVYEDGGLSSANLQHLQLDARTPYPTSISQRYTPSFYEDSTGKYMYGVSIQIMQFGGFPSLSGTDNFARNTRREQFNLLQDIGSLTGSYSTAFGVGYTGFTTAFNGGFVDPTSDPWVYFIQVATTTSANYWRITLAEANAWAMGNFTYIYRYDVINKTVIARTMVNMTRTLSGSGTNWQVATTSNGPVTSLQDGKFVVGVQNPSTYGLLVFDKDLNPLVLYQSNQYAGVLSGVAGINPLNFTTDDQTNKSFGLGRDQVRTCLVKKWGFNELGTGSYRSLVDGQSYNIFSNNTGSPASILYVNSSSQGQYSASDQLAIGTKNGGMSPLNTAKWDASTGKLIAWALFTGASTATGCYSTGGWNLVPIMIATSQPDLYQKGDTLQSQSFTTDPLTGQTLPLYVWHQMVDIRTAIVNAATGYRSTGAWDEGYYQTTFSTGSSTSFQTAGIQTMNISVCGFTGAVYEYNQDVYGTTYIKNGNGLTTGTYFSQNNFGVATQILSDPFTRFYVPTSFDTDRKYVTYNSSGALLDTFIFTGTNGQYYNAFAQLDSSSSATLRQQILNNGFAVRYGMASYDFSANFNGVPAGGAGANPIPPTRFSAVVNPNQSPILADFLFPDGHAFSLTGTYDSQPYSLTQKDLRTWIGNNTLTNAASTINPNYGKTQTFSATGIYNLLTLAQTQFSQKLVDVLYPGATYQPNPDDAGSITTVPAGSIVYRVKGAVFNGKPMRMTFQPGCANNQVLTQVMANQLNYFGGGGYGVNAFCQDSNGNWHILAGASNGNYVPYSEQVQAANYAARKTLQNLQNNTLPCSQTTLQKLGFLNATGGINVYLTPQDSDSLLTRPGAAFEGTTIRRVSDNSLVVECTIRGLWDFYASQTHNYAGYYGNGTGTYTDIRTGIRSPTVYNNDVAYSTITRIPHTATGGYSVSLTDDEMIEVETLFGTIFGYRSECMSNRLRRVISNNSMCLDAKTLTLEHIIRGPLHGWELYNSENDPDGTNTAFYGAGYKQADNGVNCDEVAGQVCCGDTYNAIQSKTHIKVYKQSDILGARAQLISYAGRPNFACSYDGQLGQQITLYTKLSTSTVYTTTTSTVTSMTGYTGAFLGILSNYTGSYTGSDGYYTGTYGPLTVEIYSTGPLGPQVAISQSVSTTVATTVTTSSTGYIYSYGNVQKFLGYYQASPISGVLTYIGKYGGKDMFASVQVQDVGGGYRRSFRNIPISTKTKLNGFDSLIGAGATLSPSGKSYIMARQNAPNRNIPWNLLPTQCRMYEGFVANDAGTDIDFIWRTAVSSPGDYNLLLGGPSNSTTTPSTAQAYANGGMNNTMFAVNDLLVATSTYSKCVFIKLSTGEILQTVYGDDLDFSENWYATKTTLATNQTTSQAPQYICGINYNSGNLIMPFGDDIVRTSEGNSGRNIAALTLKYPAKQTMNMTSIYVPTGSVGAYNSQQVIFNWNEAQTMNGGLFCLLTTFSTSDQYNNRYSFYVNKDLGYNALFDTGITAIGVYIPADISLAPFQAVSRIINSKIVNGGSWYQRTGMSLATLMPYVQFMYAGQIPYDCAIQTPYIAINDIQVLEARQCRRQKKLLQEFYRAKNGTTAPYPDNGFYMYNSPYTFNTTYKNYFNITNGNTSIRDQTLSAVYNQPLGYTDVTPGRPLQAPATN